MITAEPWAQTEARRKRLAGTYPELAHSTPSEIAEVDGAYPDRLPTGFTQDQVRLANYARDASSDAPDAAPNALPWTPSPGPLTAPEGTVDAPDTAGNVIPWRPRVTAPDPYSMEALSSTPMPPSQDYYRGAASVGETLRNVGRAAQGTIETLVGPQWTDEELQAALHPRLDDQGRLVQNRMTELGQNVVLNTFGAAHGAAARDVVGAVGQRARTWMEAAEEAAAQSSGAAEAAVRAAQPEAFQFGRGTLTEQGALRPAAVRPDDLIPRRTLLEPGGRQLGGAAGGMPMRDISKGARPGQMLGDDALSALENTPGVQMHPDGSLELDLVRYQTPEQAGAPSVRAGVFYMPEAKSPYERHFKTGANGYGGTDRIQTRSTFHDPLLVQAAAGGKAPEAAYDFLKGKKAYQTMRDDVLKNAMGSFYGDTGRRGSQEHIAQVATLLERYGVEPGEARNIVTNSAKGNTLPYAIQERIVSQAVKDAGYDGVIGYSKRLKGQPRLTEVFDVRQEDYPVVSGENRRFEEFYQNRTQPPQGGGFHAPPGSGGAELPQPETLAALRDRKLAEGLTPQQIMADPEVQDAMARVFAPDRNAIPDGPATASDITVNLRRAREQDARAFPGVPADELAAEARTRGITPPEVPEFPLQGGGVAGGAPLPGEAGFSTPRPMGETPTSGRATTNTPVPQGQPVDLNRYNMAPAPLKPSGYADVPEGALPATPFGGMEKPTTPPTFGERVNDVLGVPMGMKSTYDLSAPGRQLAPMLYAHPTAIPDVLRAQGRALRSKEAFEASQHALQTAPHAHLRELAGVELGGITDTLKREEQISSTLAQRILPASQRFNDAYTAAVNEGRDWLFRSMLDDIPPERLTEAGLRNGGLAELRQIGRLVNASTGRGDLAKVLTDNKIAGQPLLWAPKLLMGRVQLPVSMFSSNPQVRKEAARQVVAFAGTNMALLGMIKASGAADVELDPRSSDWGAIRIGNRRYDPWAGYKPLVNLIARSGVTAKNAITGSETPNVKAINKPTGAGGLYTKPGLDIITSFLRAKLAPIPGEVWNQVAGKDITGTDVTQAIADYGGDTVGRLEHGAAQLLAPIFAEQLGQEIAQGAQQGGVAGALGAAAANVPYFFGTGGGNYGADHSQIAAQGGYGTLKGRDQLDAIGGGGAGEAWRIVSSAKGLNGERYKSYYDWRDQTEKPAREALKDLPPALAEQELQKYIAQQPMAKAYSEVRNALEDRWAMDNPDEALRILNEEADLKPWERTFSPSAKVKAELFGVATRR